MRANTFIMLLIAIIFGGIAVLLANIWLNSQNRQSSPVAVTSPVESGTIVVAAVDLRFGEALTSEKLREIDWPKGSIPDGSYATIAELTAQRRVALSPIGPNEAVLKWKISGPDARASLSAVVTEGMRAVSFRINDVVGVAGFVLPGDRVDVLYTRGGDETSTDILIQNSRVLAINQMADPKSTEPVIANVVTVEVSTTDAQKIALAQTTGSLSLTLRAAGSLDKAPALRIVEQELVSSPSVYMAEFNERKAAQAALDSRLQGLEGNYQAISRRVDETDSSKEALARKLAAIDETLKAEVAKAGASSEALKAALEESVRQTAKAMGQTDEQLRTKLGALEGAIKAASQATGKGDEALRAKLGEIEQSLKGELAAADATSAALRGKLVALEAAVRQASQATGKGEEALRAKLAALEAAIRQASLATGEGEEALRAKLAEFERNLRQLASMPAKTVVVETAAAPVAEPEEAVEPLVYNVGVTRGMARQVYQVPGDFATR